MVSIKRIKKIDPCPIIEAIFEIRFIPSFPIQAVFGIIYNGIREFCSNNIVPLPVNQLPEEIRENDKNLKYSTNYELLSNNKYKIQIGPRVLLIKAPIPYDNWGIFFNEIKLITNKLIQINIINKIERIGIRYIDFFDLDIFDYIKLKLFMENYKFQSENIIIRTEIKKDDFICILQISNNTMYNNNKGSIIDLDTLNKNDLTFDDIFNKIDKAHQIQKDLFFMELLNKDFIDILNPVYEEV